MLPHAKSGRVRALAVGTPKRSPSLPEVPTVAESGYPGFDASLWLAIMAPAGTPRRSSSGCTRKSSPRSASKETAETLDKNGAEPLTSTPAELAAMIKDGVGKYAKVVKDAGVKPGEGVSPNISAKGAARRSGRAARLSPPGART